MRMTDGGATHLPELVKVLLHVLDGGVHRKTPHEDLLGSSDQLKGGVTDGNSKFNLVRKLK